MSVERYIGNYISADDASKTIDIYSINEGCRMMREASEKLDQLLKKIQLLKETSDRNSFSVNGADMEEMIGAYEDNTKKLSEYIHDLADQLSSTTLKVYNQKQTLLNEEAKRLDKQEVMIHHHSAVPVTNDSIVQVDYADNSTVQIDYAEGRNMNSEN